MATMLVSPLIVPAKADADYIGKFVWDVMMYTLPACGLNKPIILANSIQNNYRRSDFVKTVGVSVLRLCLCMRDQWREKLKKLPRKSVYDEIYFGNNFINTAKMVIEDVGVALQFDVEITLALCNEMALFFYSEKREFNLLNIVGAAAGAVIHFIQSNTHGFSLNPNAPSIDYKEELEEKLFHDVSNIVELSWWLEDFTQRHAIPYESRKNVTRIFYREVSRRWKKIVQSTVLHEGKPSNEMVKDYLGFLPEEVYNGIAAETSLPMPSYSEVAWGRKPPSSSSKSFERGAVGGSKSRRRESTGSEKASKQTAHGGHSSKYSSKQTAQAHQGRKDSLKPAGHGAQSGKDSSKQTAQDRQDGKDSLKLASHDAQSGKDSSKQTAQARQDRKDFPKPASHRAQSNKQIAEGGESGEDSSGLGIEDDLSQLNLGTEGSSEASQGAVPKRLERKK